MTTTAPEREGGRHAAGTPAGSTAPTGAAPGREVEPDGTGPTSQRPREARGEGRGSGTTRVLVTAVLLVVALYFLVPVYWVVIAATKSTEDLFGTNGFLLAGEVNLLANLRQVLSFDGGIFVRWFLNSLLYAGVGAVVATYIAALAGYALSRYDFRGRGLTYGLILGGVLVPATATALPLFLLFSEMGLANTYWSVLLPSLVSPFGVFLLRIYADAAVPDSMVEAARIDGAGELRIFHTFALRALAPALVTVLLFQVVGIWNNYFLPLVMLSDQDLYPVTLGLNAWRGQVDRLPEFYALTTGGVLLSIIPLAIAMIVLQRFWQGGLTEGAVKG